MTAQKPPDKTLVGMPADLKAVLSKLDQATADQSALSEQARPRAAPPPLPPNHGVAPPPAPAVVPESAPAPVNQAPALAMDRTLIGMPSDMQAALARAIAEQADAVAGAPASRQPPTPSGIALHAQPVRSVGVSSSPPALAQASEQAARSPRPASKPTEPAAYPPAPPRPAVHGSGLGYQSGPGDQESSRPHPVQRLGQTLLAQGEPLDWAPSAGRSDPGPEPLNLLHTADAVLEPSEHAALGTEPTQLALGAHGQRLEEPSAARAEVSRLALPLPTLDGRKTQRRQAPSKRWLAVTLAGLGMVVLAGAGVWGAPKLWSRLASGSDSASDAAPAANDAPTLPVAAITDTSAATDPAPSAPPASHPPAARALTSGAAAQLEKNAIERLQANDYPAAKQLYEQLHDAEPARREFSLMVELLSRGSARPCGQPGQAPCAGAEP